LEVAPRVEVQIPVGRAGEAVHAGVRAAPVRVDGPTERHPRALRHAVEDRSRPNLVEARVESLRRVEAAHHGLAIAGQLPPLGLGQREVAPAHERMFAHPGDRAPPLTEPLRTSAVRLRRAYSPG